MRSCLIPPHNASQVTVLGARVQSCICGSLETRAAGHARAPIFGKFVWWVLVDEISPRSRKARDLGCVLLNLLLNYLLVNLPGTINSTVKYSVVEKDVFENRQENPMGIATWPDLATQNAIEKHYKNN